MTDYYLKKPSIFFNGENRIPQDGHCVIEASAGTGKTYTITKLFVDLIYSGIAPEKCLFITFTRKATSELHLRLCEQIEELAKVFRSQSVPPTNDLNELELQTERPAERDMPQYWCFDETHQSRLCNAFDHFSRVHISTIDSLTQAMLRDNGDATSLPPGVSITHDIPYDAAFEKLMRFDMAGDDMMQAVAFAYAGKYNNDKENNKLESDSSYTARDSLKQALINAYKLGEGSAADISAMLDAGLLSEIHSPEEYRDRCIAVLDGLKTNIEALSFEDFYKRIEASNMKINQSAVEAYRAVHAALKNYDLKKSWLLIINTFDNKNIDFSKRGRARNDCDSTFTDIMSEILKLRFKASLQYFLVYSVLTKYRTRVDAEKVSSGRYGYNDFTNQLAKDVNSSELMQRRFRERWDVAVVDEFQDTSLAQWNIFRSAFMQIRNGVLTWSSGDPRLFIIGDPKQSIYAFRGGDVFMYNNAVTMIRAIDDSHVVTLDTNYRSSKGVIDVCNEIFSRLKGENLGNTPFKPVRYSHDDWKLYHKGGHDDEIEEPAACCGPMSPGALADEVQRLLDTTYVHKPTKKKLNAATKNKKIFILARTNHDLKPVAEQLAQRGIDYTLERDEDANVLFSQAVIYSLTLVMYAIHNPYKRGTLAAALNSVLFGITLDQLRNITRTQELIDTEYGKQFVEWNEQSHNSRNIGSILQGILNYTNFAERLALTGQSMEAYEQVCSVCDYLTSVAVSDNLDWMGLLARMSAIRNGEHLLSGDELPVSKTDAQVRLMTIHKSKGLEADIVFVLEIKNNKNYNYNFSKYHQVSSMHDDRSESLTAADVCPTGEDILFVPQSNELAAAATEISNENGRLLYVALTRASLKLYICCSETDNNKKKSSSRETDDNPADKSLKTFYEIVRAMTDENILQPMPTVSHRSGEPMLDIRSELSRLRERLDGSGVSDDSLGKQRTFLVRNVGSYSSTRHLFDSLEPKPDLSAHLLSSRSTDIVLRSGTNTGNYLHKLMELIPLETARKHIEDGTFVSALTATDHLSEDASAFSIRQLFDEVSGMFHITAPRERESAARLVERALSMPLSRVEGTAGLDIRLCDLSSDHISRELEFIFDASNVREAPELAFFFSGNTSRPRKGSPADSCRRNLEDYFSNHGLVQGTFDAVFEHNNIIYIVDWKSDTLNDYGQASLASRVHNEYAPQVIYYSYAIRHEIMRLNSLSKKRLSFGGMFYVFLRGVEDVHSGSSNGVYYIPAQ